MAHEIEFVKLNEEEELSEVILQVRITRFNNEPKKVKFDMVKIPLKNYEELFLKQFIQDKVINDNWDKVYTMEEINRFKEEFNKK